MEVEQLHKQVAATLTKKKVSNLNAILKLQAIDKKVLVGLTFDPDQQISFRTAWLLENLLLNHSKTLLENLDELLLRFPQVANPSCQRHFAKILMYLTSSKANPAIKAKIETADLGPIVETCFDWLINPKVAIAVKCFCSETLFNLRHRYNWIAEELAHEIKFLMKNGSPGIQSKGKRFFESFKA